MSDYGIDYSIFAPSTSGGRDLDLSFREITGLDVIEQDIYKRITTPQGLPNDDSPEAQAFPLFGCFWDLDTFNINDFINLTFPIGDANAVARTIEMKFFSELRFRVLAKAQKSPTNTLAITLYVTPADQTGTIMFQIKQEGYGFIFTRVTS